MSERKMYVWILELFGTDNRWMVTDAAFFTKKEAVDYAIGNGGKDPMKYRVRKYTPATGEAA